MRALFYTVNLTVAVWTGTLMSFVQEPVRDGVSAEDTISRADECRLLFLSQSTEHTHTHTRLVPFAPFATTTVADCNLEVREHGLCESHRLCYSSWVLQK
jgi:hypothetical protein